MCCPSALQAERYYCFFFPPGLFFSWKELSYGSEFTGKPLFRKMNNIHVEINYIFNLYGVIFPYRCINGQFLPILAAFESGLYAFILAPVSLVKIDQCM